MARIEERPLSLLQGSVLSKSAQETILLGRNFSSQLEESSFLALFGDLGTGKTTFVKGLVEGLGGQANEVQSPTFVYLNIYEGKKLPIYHFDLYRLQTPADFLEKGLEEYFFKKGICVIEWPERILPILPPHILRMDFEHKAKEHTRLIRWQKK